MAPTEMAATLPYLVISDLPRWPTSLAMRAQVLEVEQRHVLVGRHAEQDVEHALLRLVELQQAREQQRPHVLHGGADRDGPARRTGPRTRSGRRCWTSRRGRSPWRAWRARPSGSPGSEMPDRSPLMSAANTGTPAAEKPSASTCSDTVLPVPVAPVIEAVAVGELELQVLRLDAAAEEDLALLHQALALNHGALLTSAQPDAPLLNYMSTSGWQSGGARLPREKTRQFCYRGPVGRSHSPGTGAFTMRSDVPLRPIRAPPLHSRPGPPICKRTTDGANTEMSKR